MTAFSDLQNSHGVLAPSLLRQFSFVSSYIPTQINSRENAFKAISKADIVLENYALYEEIVREKKYAFEFFKSIKDEAYHFLEENALVNE